MHQFRKSKFRHAGFSLIEIIVATAILAVVTLGIAGAVGGLMRAQTIVSDRDEANEFAASLGRYLYSDTGCDSALLNTPFSPGGIRNLVVNGYNGYGSTGATAIAAGTSISPRLRVKALTLKDKGMAPQPVQSSNQLFSRYVAQVNLGLERLEDGQWRDIPPRFYEFPVLVQAGVIRACQLELELDDACTLLGSTLAIDPATGMRVCRPATQCQVKGVYSSASCSPAYGACNQGIPNQLTGALSCPAGAVASKTGQMETSFAVSCGKKCSTNVTQTIEFFVCMQCQ